jgi:hypothetical protein
MDDFFHQIHEKLRKIPYSHEKPKNPEKVAKKRILHLLGNEKDGKMHVFCPFSKLFCRKIWRIKKNALPLHPISRATQW